MSSPGALQAKPTGRRAAHLALGGMALLLIAGFAGLDRAAYDWTVRNTNTPNPLDADFYQMTRPLWSIVRLFGHWWAIAVASLALLAISADGWRHAARLIVCVALAVGLTYGLKAALGRDRPNQASSHLSFKPIWTSQKAEVAGQDVRDAGTATDRELRTASFPSGEATTAFALATALGLIWRRARWLWFLLAALTGLARLVQGSHYVSDVAAAGLCGIGLVLAADALLPRPRSAGPPAPLTPAAHTAD